MRNGGGRWTVHDNNDDDDDGLRKFGAVSLSLSLLSPSSSSLTSSSSSFVVRRSSFVVRRRCRCRCRRCRRHYRRCRRGEVWTCMFWSSSLLSVSSATVHRCHRRHRSSSSSSLSLPLPLSLSTSFVDVSMCPREQDGWWTDTCVCVCASRGWLGFAGRMIEQRHGETEPAILDVASCPESRGLDGSYLWQRTSFARKKFRHSLDGGHDDFGRTMEAIQGEFRCSDGSVARCPFSWCVK